MLTLNGEANGLNRGPVQPEIIQSATWWGRTSGTCSLIIHDVTTNGPTWFTCVSNLSAGGGLVTDHLSLCLSGRGGLAPGGSQAVSRSRAALGESLANPVSR